MNDAIKVFEKVTDAKSEMLKQVQQDRLRRLIDSTKVFDVREETKGFKKVHAGAGDPGSSPG